jgi:hypothetical protein
MLAERNLLSAAFRPSAAMHKHTACLLLPGRRRVGA